MKRLIILTILIGITLQSYAQVTITGVVSDATSGEKLIGATVVLLSDLSNGTVTDEDGSFQIELHDSKQSAELLVQYVGFEEKLIEVNVAVSKDLQIELEASSILIEEVTIKATPTLGEEFVVKEITKLEIYTNPNSRADPIRAVNSLPASTSINETANLSLRGSPPAETGFVLNRVPIDDAFKLDQSNGVGQFSIFNTSIISKVDVYPSNPPLEFGGASSGLIALYTDDVSEVNSRSINLTMAGIGAKFDQRINTNNGLVAYANYSLNNGLKALNEKAFEDLESFDSFDSGVYWVSQLKDQTKLKVFNYSLIENYAYRVDQVSYSGSSLQEKKRNQTIINVEKQIGKQTNFDFNQGINFSKASYSYGNTEHFQEKKDLFSSINISRFSDFWTYAIGLSVKANHINNQGQYPEYYWALDPNHPTIDYGTKEWFLLPELYNYQKLNFSENFTLGISDRRTIASSENVGEFSSNQVNLSYKLNAANSFKFSMGKYHKLFIPGEQFYETTLASSRQYSLDYNNTKTPFNLNAAVYVKKTQYNERSIAIYGAELFLAYENESLKTSVSLAHVNAEVTEQGRSYPSENDVNFFFRHLLKYKLGPHLEFNSILFLRSGSYYTPVSGSSFHAATQTFEPIYSGYQDMQRLPNYSLWDLSISKFIKMGNGVMIVFISSSNVLNTKNVSGFVYNESYDRIGDRYFGSRVIFMGAVYNW